jgi:phosphohistidine phosphatase SixA
MTKIVVRHGFSSANDRENYGTLAFGNQKASLHEKGEEQAFMLGRLLVVDFGIKLEDDVVAVSEMRRSQETAIVAGFRRIHIYPELNEEKGGLSDADIRIALESRRPPEAAIKAAQSVIEHPPEEQVWVTHALLIATICQQLGIYTNERFTPKFCEIRELPL